MITRESIITKHIDRHADRIVTKSRYPLAGCRGCPHLEKFQGSKCGVLHEYQQPCFVQELARRHPRGMEEDW